MTILLRCCILVFLGFGLLSRPASLSGPMAERALAPGPHALALGTPPHAVAAAAIAAPAIAAPAIAAAATITPTHPSSAAPWWADYPAPPWAESHAPYTPSYRGYPAPWDTPLFGEVRDQATGRPVANPLVQLHTGGSTPRLVRPDELGRFVVADVDSVQSLLVKAPGYRRLSVPITDTTAVALSLEPFQARGIYIPFGLLAVPERVIELLDMIDRTELNAVVVDVKSDYARLAWPSKVTLAVEAGADQPGLMDLTQFVSECRKRDIYAIARMVIFKDDRLARARPDLAVKRVDGRPYVDWEDLQWSDPFRGEVRQYNLDLLQEVIALGFDEVQFDYLRFPSDGKITSLAYAQESTLESRTATMAEFCRQAHELTNLSPAFLSADVFGLTVWVESGDMGIGQRLEDIAPYMDYMSPMLYPSTFIPGNLGLDAPLLYPYEVINRSVEREQERSATLVRPWLQHYTLGGVDYGPVELLKQKRGAEDAGSSGWIYWNAAGRYRPEIFEPGAYERYLAPAQTPQP